MSSTHIFQPGERAMDGNRRVIVQRFENNPDTCVIVDESVNETRIPIPSGRFDQLHPYTGKRTATQEAAIAAAAAVLHDLLGEDGNFPHYNGDTPESNRVRGMCEVIAGTFGTRDKSDPLGEVSSEISTKLDEYWDEPSWIHLDAIGYAARTLGTDAPEDAFEAVCAAYLAGMNARG